MRRLKRNQRQFSYATIKEMEEQKDAANHLTGRREVVYNTAIDAMGCIVFKGTSYYKPYGIDEDWSICVIPDNPLSITVGTKITIDGKDYFVMSHPTSMNEQRIYCR